MNSKVLSFRIEDGKFNGYFFNWFLNDAPLRVKFQNEIIESLEKINLLNASKVVYFGMAQGSIVVTMIVEELLKTINVENTIKLIDGVD